MKLDYIKTISVASGFLLLLPCRPMYIKQIPEIKINGPYKHKYLPISFPENILNFKRVRITKFAEDEKDVAIGYDLKTSDKDISFTIYLTSASKYNLTHEDTLVQIIENSKGSILYYYDSVEIISEENSKFKNLFPGKRIVFKYRHPERSDPSYSELYLYKISDWIIKYRISYPIYQEIYVQEDIENIIKEIENYYLDAYQ